MTFKDGYQIRRMGQYVELIRDGHLIHRAQSLAECTREYIRLTERKLKVDEELGQIRFPIEELMNESDD